MLAVTLPEAELQSLLPGDLSISLINGPSLCVVAGPPAAVEEFSRTLTARGVIFRAVQNTHAFHSRLMDPVVAAFEAEVRQVRLNRPQVPFISNVTGRWISDADATDPAYWARHLNHTARFNDALRTVWQMDAPLLLEAGPGENARRSGQPASGETKRRIAAGHRVDSSSLRKPTRRGSAVASGRQAMAGWRGYSLGESCQPIVRGGKSRCPRIRSNGRTSGSRAMPRLRELARDEVESRCRWKSIAGFTSRPGNERPAWMETGRRSSGIAAGSSSPTPTATTTASAMPWPSAARTWNSVRLGKARGASQSMLQPSESIRASFEEYLRVFRKIKDAPMQLPSTSCTLDASAAPIQGLATALRITDSSVCCTSPKRSANSRSRIPVKIVVISSGLHQVIGDESARPGDGACSWRVRRHSQGALQHCLRQHRPRLLRQPGSATRIVAGSFPNLPDSSWRNRRLSRRASLEAKIHSR